MSTALLSDMSTATNKVQINVCPGPDIAMTKVFTDTTYLLIVMVEGMSSRGSEAPSSTSSTFDIVTTRADSYQLLWSGGGQVEVDSSVVC
jgi:hypothetical protein